MKNPKTDNISAAEEEESFDGKKKISMRRGI